MRCRFSRGVRHEACVNRLFVASRELHGTCGLIAFMNKESKKTIGLVAHDNRKRDLIEWVDWNSPVLLQHRLVCTGTTGRLVEEASRRVSHVRTIKLRFPRSSGSSPDLSGEISSSAR